MAEIKTGFESIVERKIRDAQEKGTFDNLPGSGKPLSLDEDKHVPEDLRLAHKILKNAGYLPPEIQLKKEIQSIEDLLAGTEDAAQKHKLQKKLNFLTIKLNASGSTRKCFAVPETYAEKVMDKLESGKSSPKSPKGK